MPQRFAESRQPGSCGHVREGSIAIVAVEDVLSPVGDEQVFEAIIVVVADADAAGPAVFEQSRHARSHR